MKLFARPAVRITVALFAVVGLLVLAVGPAFAHSNLKSVSPPNGSVLDAAPEKIVLTFTAKVLPDFTQVAVNCEGKDLTDLPKPTTVDDTVRQPIGAAASGACTLTFRIVSADSHPISGQSTFTVNAPAPSSAAPSAEASASATTAPSTTPSTSPTPATSATASASDTAATEPGEGAQGSSTLTSTALLVLLAAALLGLFAWLARGRRSQR
jgi:methionine-rich copper-binding protein CopC